MKIFISSVIVLTFFSLAIEAQNIITLNQPETGNQLHIASQKIEFLDGYNYKAMLPSSLKAYIDPTVPQPIVPLVYSPLHDDVSFNSRTINTALAVGRINGTSSVSSSGGASYSIPITLPPGTNGHSPTLSLEYSSQNGNSFMGLGWGLSGVSSIYRVPKDLYHDDEVTGVHLDGTDFFAMDGNRLVLTGGTYGNDAATYATEVESFNQITSRGVSGSGPNWFQVDTKSGLTLEFGRTSDSKHILAGQNSVATWHINKVTDNYGNSYLYHYRLEDNEVLLHKITYADNVIVFSYSERSDKNRRYVAGHLKKENVLLSSILILNAHRQVAKYEFKYAENIYSYLNEIKQFGSDNKALNSTLFKYGQSSYSVVEQTVVNSEILPTNNNATDAEYWSGDYNGDGKTDLIALSYGFINVTINGQNYIVKNWLDWTLHINEGDNTYSSGTPQSFPVDFSPGDHIQSINSGRIGNTSLQNFDMNGDGMEDIIFTLIKPYDYIYDDYIVYPYYSNGAGFTAQSSISRRVYNSYHQQLFNNGYTHRHLDFNGDGKLDLLTHNKSNIGYPNGTTASSTEVIFGFDETDPNSILNAEIDGKYFLADQSGGGSFPMDINGDGRSELVDIYNDVDGLYYSMELVDGQFVFNQQSGKIGFNAANTPGLFADFNGDGNIDILKYFPQSSPTNTYSWEMQNSKGDLNFKLIDMGTFLEDPTVDMANDNKEVFHYALDMNGDWRSDIVEVVSTRPNASSNSSTTINIYYSNGLDFIKKTYNPSQYIDPKTQEIEFGDFNGDGKIDLHYHEFGFALGSGVSHTIYYFQKDKKENLLHGILDGFNNQIEFEYSYLTDNAIYTKGNSSITDVLNAQFTMPVVTQVQKPDGIGGDYVIEYNYEGAMIHQKGKGFLGFQKIEEENLITEIKTISKYEVDPTYYITNLKEERKELASTNELLYETDYQYNYLSMGGKRVFPFVADLTQIAHKLNYTTTRVNVYDNYGNLKSVTLNKGGIEASTITNTYGMYGSWIPSSILTTNISKTRQGNSSSYDRTTSFTYTPEGSILQKVDDPGDAKSIITTFGYNSMGNQTSRTTVGSGISISEIFEYDNLGKLPIEQTNDKGQKAYIKYDMKFGVPVEEIGVNNLITKYSYDGFGRIERRTRPGSITEENQFAWDIGAGGAGSPTTVSNSIYTKKITSPGSPEIKQWFDSFGRERKKEVDGFSQKIIEVTAYDARGNIWTKTSPFEQGGVFAPIVTTNSYDDLNQVVSVSNSAGATNYSYTYSAAGVEVTATLPNQSTIIHFTDPTNRLVSSNDNGGTLTYTYYSSGLQKEIKLNGTTISSMEYDLQGHQTQLIDINAGTTDYTYNAYGELISQSDAKGLTTLQYNDHNQLIAKVTPEATITYAYSQTGGGINQLESIVNSNGSADYLKYDKYGRIVKSRTTIDNEDYEYHFTFDLYGRSLTEQFPSGFSILREYTTHGYLKKISNQNDGLKIWEASAMNAFGQYLNVSKGDGANTNYVYDQYGLLSEVNGPLDMDFSFSTTTGNLEDRRDNHNLVFEEFEYDNLDRLSKMSFNGVDRTIQFQNNGNITKKDEITEYQYSNAKPNAIESVKDLTGIISSDVQNITYNAYHQPETITEALYELNFSYDSEGQRISSKLKNNGNLIRTRYYLPNYEKQVFEDTNEEQLIHYIHGGDGLAAMYVIEDGVGKMYFTYTDYLGSILKVTDVLGNTVVEQNFDAWGRRRGSSDWSYASVDVIPDWLYRGYTGHEHYDEFALINMNGRMYDPLLGRMLSTDNYVQDANNTQNFNRYSYALNNPLKYTDPSGEILGIILIGAVINIIVNGIQNTQNDKPFFRGAYQAAVIGAIAGAFAYGIGNIAVGFSGFGQVLFQASSHGFLGGALSSAHGGTFGQGFAAGAVGSLVASGTGHILKNVESKFLIGLGTIGSGSVSAGIGAEIAGGDFWDGFRIGAISSTLNHFSHIGIEKIQDGRYKTITADKGGFIDNKDDFLEYMTGQAKNNSVEVAAFELDDGRFFIQPWENNTYTTSINDINAIPGYDRSSVVGQYHTHPSGIKPTYGFPSNQDAIVSNNFNIPIHTITSNGSVWRVYYPKYMIVPKSPKWMPIGYKIR